jgi:hypothetical protein
VLAQCAALTLLNLLTNYIGPGGAESLSRVLDTTDVHGQDRACRRCYNRIGTLGRERLRTSWRGPTSGLFL